MLPGGSSARVWAWRPCRWRADASPSGRTGHATTTPNSPGWWRTTTGTTWSASATRRARSRLRPEPGAGFVRRSVRLALDVAAQHPVRRPAGFRAEQGTAYRVGAEHRAALQAELPGPRVDLLEVRPRAVLRHVDGLGDGVVHQVLQGRLHGQVLGGGDVPGAAERVRHRLRSAVVLAPVGVGIVGHVEVPVVAGFVQHPAVAFQRKDGFDAAGDVVGQQADGAGGGDGEQMAVADAIGGDGVADGRRQTLD